MLQRDTVRNWQRCQFYATRQFFFLYQSFKKINEQLGKNLKQLPTGEKIMLRTPVENFLLCLTKKEFRQVLELFEQADMKLRLLNILEQAEKMN